MIDKHGERHVLVDCEMLAMDAVQAYHGVVDDEPLGQLGLFDIYHHELGNGVFFCGIKDDELNKWYCPLTGCSLYVDLVS